MSSTTKEELCKYWHKFRMMQDETLLSAFLEIPRENFVPPDGVRYAYEDHPLSIGYGQTISQPTTVMLMLQLLGLQAHHTVLEIGAGSGYNAALISRIAKQVYSIERIPDLITFAQNNLKRSHVENVQVIHGDGKQGYPDEQPYDRIIVTAAASQIPPALLEQLVPEGILVAPVGSPYGCEMLKITKQSNGQFNRSAHGMYSFVPLV